MQKRNKRKKKEKSLSAQPVYRPAQNGMSELTENASPFDFGGLPARELKKNLGCG